MRYWGVLFAMALGIVRAYGHDPEHPELNSWYSELSNANGNLCCDERDRRFAEDWDAKDGHYLVRIEGSWLNVPDNAIVKGPNKAGRPLVWLMFNNGQPVVRCFMPGAGI